MVSSFLERVVYLGVKRRVDVDEANGVPYLFLEILCRIKTISMD